MPNGDSDDPDLRQVPPLSPEETEAARAPAGSRDTGDQEAIYLGSGKSSEQLAADQAHLANTSFAQDIRERKSYADKAYSITLRWIAFLIALTFCQMFLKRFGYSLTEKEFIVVFTTTTASVFGYWVLVGRYLFDPGRRQQPIKPARD